MLGREILSDRCRIKQNKNPVPMSRNKNDAWGLCPLSFDTGPKCHIYFYSLVLFLCFSISIPIVPYAPAFLDSFLFQVTVVKSIGSKHHQIYIHGTGIVLLFFDIYPIIPNAPAFLHSFPSLVTVVKGIGPKCH